MTADEQRAALAAQEALNRGADEVIAGLAGDGQNHPPHDSDTATEPQQAVDLDALAQQDVEPQPYQQYAPEAYAADSAEYGPDADAQPDPYAAAYTPEQQAAEQQAAEAYAAQFAASIAETAVASATQHANQAAPEGNAPPEDFAPEIAVAAALTAALPPAAAQSPAAQPPEAVTQSRERATPTSMLTWFFALVAALAVGASLYQGYLFHRSTEAIEKNAMRGELARTCRDIVGSYFDVKQKVSVLMPAADRGNIAGASRVTEANRLEAQASITKFSGLSAYLASFQDAGARVRYGELTRALNGIMDVARTTPLTDLDRVFAPADKIFSGLNDDCVKTSGALRN